MICDKIENLPRYRGLSPALDLAIQTIGRGLTGLPMGQNPVDGERVYYNHFQYDTVPRAPDSLFEAHRRYLDLHLVLSGRERMLVAPVETLEQVEVRESEDSVMYTGRGETGLYLPALWFALVYPGEGHLGRLWAGDGPERVDKAVFKIEA